MSFLGINCFDLLYALVDSISPQCIFIFRTKTFKIKIIKINRKFKQIYDNNTDAAAKPKIGNIGRVGAIDNQESRNIEMFLS